MASCTDCLYWDTCEFSVLKGVCPNFKNKADFVEVVRCKGCEYSYLCGNDYVCENSKAPWYCSDEYAIIVGSDDFCSYGERRTDNDFLL